MFSIIAHDLQLRGGYIVTVRKIKHNIRKTFKYE